MIESRARKFQLVFVLLALVGAAVSLYLTRLHFALMIPGASVDSICNVNAVVNCAAVSESEYAHLGKIPVSGIGFLYYIIAALFALLAFSRRDKRVFLFLFIPAAMAAAVSAFMLYASYQLGLVCPFCMVLHGIDFLLLALAPFAAGVGFRGLGSALRGYMASFSHFLRAGLVSVILLGVGLYAVAQVADGVLKEREIKLALEKNRHEDSDEPLLSPEDIAELVGLFYQKPAIDLSIPSDRPYFGTPNAPIQIVEFVDFQCPACAQAAQSLPVFLQENYPGKFAITLLNYPLDMTCNPNLKRKMHPFACEAAAIGICVNRLSDEFWAFEEQVFGHQSEIKSETLGDWAQAVGVNRAALADCIANPETTKAIAEDVALGGKVPVTGTPTLLLNGRALESAWRNEVLFKAILDRALIE